MDRAMQLVKNSLILIIFMFITASVHAEEAYNSRHLTQQEIQRVKAVKVLLDGIDKKTLWETIAELEKTRHPRLNLEMREAMARAYTDIVRDINVEGQKKKEWLYSMVCLNMAYLQFGGDKGKPGSTTELNRLIRQELLKYLPADVTKQPGFIYSLE
jgi:cell division protein FtsB